MQKQLLFKVEKQRVLVPVGAPCPFGCRYCYTRGGEVGVAHTNGMEILARFQHFLATNPIPFETIQFGYDGDPFAFPERGLMMLNALAKLGKHVNFSTKAALTEPILQALDELRAVMEARDTTLSALVSLSCWDSAPRVEPLTPSPIERIQTVASLARLRIPVFIAIRPILPHVADEEYTHICTAGILAGADGFVLGPLYANDRGQFVRDISPELLASTPHRRGTVSWSAHAPQWTRYEDPVRLQRLIALVQARGGRVFLSSADAMALVSRGREVA